MTNKLNEIGQKMIVLMHADLEESAGISQFLKEAHFNTQCVDSPFKLKEKMKNANFFAAILDLDLVGVDNRTIRDLSSTFPSIPFLCISKERIHPELKNSIRNHICACLTKPIDLDELSYWSRCIWEDDQDVMVGEASNDNLTL